mgnify:CR=1 FL=1
MFYLFLIFHILLLIESYHLWKKRQKRKCLILTVSNIIVFVINLLKLAPTLNKDLIYSDMIFLKLELVNHTISSILWLILNLAFYAFLYYILKKAFQKKKQNSLLKNLIIAYAFMLACILLIALFNNIAAWLILIGIIISLIWLVKAYIKTKKNYVFVAMIILIIIGIYSFTTYTGAARLQIALQGYVVEAYDTGLEELIYYQEKNSKRYAPIRNIEVEQGQLGFVEVDNYLGIKIGTYVGY